MTITTTTNPDAIRMSDDHSVIYKDDMDWLNELAENIRHCSDIRIIQEAEHDFHDEMTKRYGGKVSGELLSMLWKMTS